MTNKLTGTLFHYMHTRVSLLSPKLFSKYDSTDTS